MLSKSLRNLKFTQNLRSFGLLPSTNKLFERIFIDRIDPVFEEQVLTPISLVYSHNNATYAGFLLVLLFVCEDEGSCIPEDVTLFSHNSENHKFKIRDIYIHFTGRDKYKKK
jgi:hypothetical protein